MTNEEIKSYILNRAFQTDLPLIDLLANYAAIGAMCDANGNDSSSIIVKNNGRDILIGAYDELIDPDAYPEIRKQIISAVLEEITTQFDCD